MKALLTGAFSYTQEQLDKIKSAGYEITYIQDERIRLDTDVSEFDAVVCNSLFLYNDIEAFKNLKFVQATSAGLDRLPVDYMDSHGIKYSNAKNTYAVPMAEWAVMSLLEIFKSSPALLKNQQNRIWDKKRNLLELTDKTVGIIGFGNVGREIAKRLKPFGVKIIAVDKFEIKNENVDYWQSSDMLDETLPKCNAVILCVPLNDETKHLICEKQLKLMKDGCALINISRGAIIDEKALCDNMINKFRGIALDVFEEEPLNEKSNLWNNDKVIVTPHNSFVSDMCSGRLFDIILDNLKLYCGG
ncbi:MAG: NAD(P)-dependent oxidoreductase [Eubacterium sp.]